MDTKTSFSVLGQIYELNPITLQNVADVRVATKLSLTNLLYSEAADSLPQLNIIADQQPDLFAQMMWQLCKRQAREYKITDPNVFCDALFQTEAAIDAERALACAIPFSFREPTRHQLQLALMESSLAVVEMREEKRREDVARVVALQSTTRTPMPLKNSVGTSPASSESTPDLIPSPTSGECSEESKSTTTSN